MKMRNKDTFPQMENVSEDSSIQILEVSKLEKGRRRLRFDNGISAIFYRMELRGLEAEEGRYLTKLEYETLLGMVTKRAKKRALHLLEQMDHTEYKLREKLARTEYPRECIDEAISYVKQYHYIDDLRYAENYIRYYKERFSRMQIRQKLIAKGISGNLIERAIASEYDSEETEQIKNLLAKKHFDPQHCDEGEFRRIYQYILRRGFRSNDILKEMRNYEKEEF